MTDEAIAALRRAVDAMPDDVALRLHLAELELGAGYADEAISTLTAALAIEPGNPTTRALMARALGAPVDDGFDWDAAADDLDVPRTYVEDDDEPSPPASVIGMDAFIVERPRVTLADVGGLEKAKARLHAAFLAPLTNPGLRQLYGKSLRGGLLLYGPPGCGKTFLARAVAGELGASFVSIAVTDVLDHYIGASERNLHMLFNQARRNAPCVVFLDELDTLGQRRSSSSPVMTGVVNQLLTELDGFAGENEGVFVLGATNQPWQVDGALRRPGRFDRTVLVLPPDAPAREAIFRHHLTDRPVEGINLRRLAALTEGHSGADIAFICEDAAERALLDSVASGEARMITMDDLTAAIGESHPSIGPWLETARNVVQFGQDDGTFGELRSYLKKARRL